MTRLPLTVIGGYLGAGKTTLINHILRADHGKKLMVMVNDFGAVNVDAALIKAQGADTLELTNGCVCCTMGADLFMAVGDVLDRVHRPEHLIIEASGVADPARIAEVARNEPDLSYAGIVTVVDGLNYETLRDDKQVGAQVRGQVSAADLIYVSKTDTVPNGVTGAPVSTDATALEALLWEIDAEVPTRAQGHAHFTRWQADLPARMRRAQLVTALKARPAGLYRVKGFVTLDEDGMTEVQVVGKSVELSRSDYSGEQVLVGIGPAGGLDAQALNRWWAAAEQAPDQGETQTAQDRSARNALAQAGHGQE